MAAVQSASLRANTPKPKLLEIPRELRNYIYLIAIPSRFETEYQPASYAADQALTISASLKSTKGIPWRPILRFGRTCKQIHREIEDELTQAWCNGVVGLVADISKQEAAITGTDDALPPKLMALVEKARKVAIHFPLMITRWVKEGEEENAVAEFTIDDDSGVWKDRYDLLEAEFSYDKIEDHLSYRGSTWDQLNNGEEIGLFPLHLARKQDFVADRVGPQGEVATAGLSMVQIISTLQEKLSRDPDEWLDGGDIIVEDLAVAVEVKAVLQRCSDHLFRAFTEVMARRSL